MTKVAAVVGASGLQGNAVAKALLADGWTVRALGRKSDNPLMVELKSKGAEIVITDINKEEDLERAFKGADAVFHVTNVIEAGPEGELRQGILAVDVAKKVGVGHFVFSSLSNAERISKGKFKVANFTFKSLVDDHLFSSGLVATVVQIALYYDNWIRYLKWQTTEDGGYEFFIPGPPDSKYPLAAAGDIAPTVAKVMADKEKYNGRTVPVVGDFLTANEIAATFQKVWQKPVRAHALPYAEYLKRDDITAAAIFANQHQYFEEFGYFGEKTNNSIGNRLSPGIRSFEQWIREKMPNPPTL